MCTSVPAFGWGCEGHQMVALIARAHLKPEISAAVDKLLNENPLDPNQKRYCQGRPADPMADAASWADDMKSVDKTFDWHFVDIPLGVRGADVDSLDVTKWCQPIGPSVSGKDRPGCLTTAIDYEWSVLRDATLPAPDRAKALRYLIHFLGDMTQPLHDTDNHDQGGNCTRMAFFTNGRLENLHAIWDERMIGRDLATRRASQQEYAAGLDKEFAGSWSQWGEAKIDVLAWVWEGHEVAARITYGKLKPRLPVARPSEGQIDREGCNLERTRVEGMHIAIGDEYFNAAMPVVREQLTKAAYRLADLLNRGF
jgi:hypothetical protein